MAYTTIDKPSDYFNTITYTGDNTDRSFTGVGFQPDWVWVKARNNTTWHMLFDAVRGAGVEKELHANSTQAEGASDNVQYGYINSFDTDGFSTIDGTHSSDALNESARTYVAWNWLASNTTASNTNGTITSTVSANTTAGFSIVSYTGNGTLGATVGHGLGSVPSMILVKRRNTTGNWWTYHSGLGGANKYIVLNSTSAVGTSTNIWNNTAPTSTVFSLGDNSSYPEVNGTSNTFIAYCFAEKKGYSKIGSYTGNGSTDGTFIYTGFKPSWVLLTASSIGTEHWWIYDNKRSESNVTNDGIVASLNNTEYTDNATFKIDMLSNGFKPRNSDGSHNGSGTSYIYMAFAEHPFVSSTGTPVTAR